MVNDIQLKVDKVIAQRHDAMVTVVHQVLLQYHPGILWEQRTVLPLLISPVLETFITLTSHWVVLHTFTSLSVAQLGLLLFPLLLLRLRWLLLMLVCKSSNVWLQLLTTRQLKIVCLTYWLRGNLLQWLYAKMVLSHFD